MDESSLRKALAGLPLGGVRYYDQTGSTNDVALAWAGSGAPDLSLIYAEEQTAGRGRGDRTWFTPPGAAMAVSLLFRPRPSEQTSIPLFSALGALAVCQVLESFRLGPQIKWPNDVLLRRRKAGGILAESTWIGQTVDSIVVGIGINIKPASVPPPEQLNFPATCLEGEVMLDKAASLHQALDRPTLLRHLVLAILQWRELLTSPVFLQAWESRLAFRGEQVEVWGEGQPIRAGELLGLAADGSLSLRSPMGEVFSVPFGEIHLRLV
jgi:BirA family biotin operon repressor/biotin-[acetyl-CoA-carboxylase] ligase